MLKHTFPVPRPGSIGCVLALIAGAGVPAFSQTPPDNVHWSASVASGGAIKAGGNATVEITGAIDDGWHVYGLKQLPDGPTPLRVKLDANDTATAAGDPAESPPEKIHDPRFGLDTQFHTHALTLRLPVQVASQASGNRTIPVSVRFQLCSDSDCQPPRTVHLAVPVDVASND